MAVGEVEEGEVWGRLVVMMVSDGITGHRLMVSHALMSLLITH